MEIAKEIVRKNLLSIICGVVALVSVIAYFYPVDGMLYSSFSETLNGQKKQYDDAHRAWSSDRKPPTLGGPEFKQKGEWFPNRPTIDLVKRNVKDYAASADLAADTALDDNRQDHFLIEPSALPHPTDSNAPYNFRTAYNEVMRPGGKPALLDPHKPFQGPLNLPDQVLDSAPPATDAEIQDALKKLWDEKYSMRIIVNNGKDSNRAEVEEQFKADTLTFPQNFHRTRARLHKLYMDPEALIRVPTLTNQSTPSPTEMWFAQMVYWVELDVCRAIARVNEKVSEGVPQSPVKNLLEVSMAPNIGMYVTSDRSGVAGAAAAAGNPQPEPSPPNFARSPTGRVCNTLYDVVEFDISLIADAKQVKPILQSLRAGKFITVTRLEAESVDNRVAEGQGYIYGPSPCVQLTLHCEELFLHGWTVGYRATDKDVQSSGPMPAEVQKSLGITAPIAPQKDAPSNVAMTP